MGAGPLGPPLSTPVGVAAFCANSSVVCILFSIIMRNLNAYAVQTVKIFKSCCRTIRLLCRGPSRDVSRFAVQIIAAIGLPVNIEHSVQM